MNVANASCQSGCQRPPVLDDAVGGPGDPLRVLLPGGLAIGAQGVEVALREPLQHQVDVLLGRPGGGLSGSRRAVIPV